MKRFARAPTLPEPGAQPSAATPERLLVCVSSGPDALPVVQAAQKLAATFEAEWRALYIETPEQAARPPEEQEEAFRALHLALQLGAPAHKRAGFRVLEEIIQFAREHQVTKIVVGRPRPRPWWHLWEPSLVEHLLRALDGNLDVYVIQTDGGAASQARTRKLRQRFLPPPVRNYAWATGGIGLCTALAGLLFPFLTFTNLVMTYLLAVVIISATLGRGPSVFASFLSVAAFAFFFVPEYWSFSPASAESVVTLAVMLLVSMLIGGLGARVRHQAQAVRQQERETAALYEMNQNLTGLSSLDELLEVAVAQIGKIFGGQAAILMPASQGILRVKAGAPLPPEDEKEWAVARWVYRYGHAAGCGTETLHEVKGLYLPLRTSQAVIGVLRLETAQFGEGLAYERLRLLETLGGQVALAIERENLSRQAEQARFEVEAERLRNILLSSVSHDLRTPLTVIAGSASTLLEGEEGLDAQTKRELTQSIFEEAKRLDRLVHNLLEMSRLESGEVALHKDWQVLEEVLGCALGQLETQLKGRPVEIHLPPDLPLVRMDALLMERVFVNLLENAIKYTPPQSPVEIVASRQAQDLLIEVADRGPGLPEGEEDKVFEKFYQAAPGGGRGGGLGLAICRSIVEAHGGGIGAANRPGGGAIFRVSIPLTETLSLDQSLVEGHETSLHESTNPPD
jgi:two-component system sensor histidine kinase KdpD